MIDIVGCDKTSHDLGAIKQNLQINFNGYTQLQRMMDNCLNRSRDCQPQDSFPRCEEMKQLIIVKKMEGRYKQD